ncbi:MqnA/MqnD/SBP family protein [Nitratiruptor sp. YY09-18]|uniref:MqnA/MqnD/SBP family protein n=1 Tax=Nitratiruptor sp. YY09-18 TaxID=2724901 RepID=UPI001914FEA7|nr:MqnA/MqnD/SBP family protein [Nitratiruptor sp. YY09-18]BCD68767.1 chorismate dehydratase [Nitratiruptor sp. YY09-18]
MIIGKIDFINLLPFYVFLKRELTFQEKSALEFYKGVPSHVNRLYKKRRVEAAVISSIFSRNQKCSRLGIVANKKVLSVLICPGEDMPDSDSNTSNILAHILGVQGRVLIGDKALLHQGDCQDLATLWYKRYKLPFVFARFCYRCKDYRYKRLSNKFLHSHIKIPHYILKRYAKRSGLSIKQIRTYLEFIHYTIGKKEELALKKFLSLAIIEQKKSRGNDAKNIRSTHSHNSSLRT